MKETGEKVEVNQLFFLSVFFIGDHLWIVDSSKFGPLRLEQVDEFLFSDQHLFLLKREKQERQKNFYPVRDNIPFFFFVNVTIIEYWIDQI